MFWQKLLCSGRDFDLVGVIIRLDAPSVRNINRINCSAQCLSTLQFRLSYVIRSLVSGYFVGRELLKIKGHIPNHVDTFLFRWDTILQTLVFDDLSCRDGSSQQLGGCLRDFRNKPFPVKVKVEYYRNVLTVSSCSILSSPPGWLWCIVCLIASLLSGSHDEWIDFRRDSRALPASGECVFA